MANGNQSINLNGESRIQYLIVKNENIRKNFYGEGEDYITPERVYGAYDSIKDIKVGVTNGLKYGYIHNGSYRLEKALVNTEIIEFDDYDLVKEYVK